MAVLVDLIVNPLSGPVSARLPRASRLAFATRVLEASGTWAVRATETHSPHDGVEAARRAVAEGVRRVVVWGGDGTVSAMAAALAGSPTALAVVPGGSGNGFARALGLPLEIEAALSFAVTGGCRPVDLGCVDDRPFVNMAGIGLDAAIAGRYNRMAGARRGLQAYLRACFAEIGRHTLEHVRVQVDGADWFAGAADLIAVANGQQYGHGALIAPGAVLDDGVLDVVMVPDITRARMVRHGWRLFAGTLARVPGVRVARGQRIRVVVSGEALMHRDGEVEPVTAPLQFAVRPRQLQVVRP